MRVRAKTVVLVVGALLVVAVLGLLTSMGWQVVLGPDARPVTDRKFEVTDARLARGEYLVNGPLHCFHCHSDHDFSNPEYPIKDGTRGAGWVMPVPELNNIPSKNITPDRETGLGDWTDDEIARAIREGVSRKGNALFPAMPYPAFAHLDDEDLASIVVYLRTIPAIRHEVPARHLPFPLEYIANTIPKPLTQPQPSHPSSTPVERGEYLVTIAGCGGCHTPTNEKGIPLPGMGFSGGGLFHDPGQGMKPVFSMNITPDPSGIAHYDASFFIEVIRTGAVKGRTLSHIMPLAHFRNMTDEDLTDMFAYLQTLPPVKHRVSNTDPPTFCEVCGQTHGLGEFNKKAPQ